MLWERREKMLWERRAGIGRVDRESDPPNRPQQMTWGKHHSRHHQFMSLACLGGFMAIRYGKEGVSVPPSISMDYFLYYSLEEASRFTYFCECFSRVLFEYLFLYVKEIWKKIDIILFKPVFVNHCFTTVLMILCKAILSCSLARKIYIISIIMFAEMR